MSAAASRDAAAPGERVEVAAVRAPASQSPARPPSTSSSMPSAAQPLRLASVARARAKPASRAIELLDDDVGGDVLLARRVERRSAPVACAR